MVFEWLVGKKRRRQENNVWHRQTAYYCPREPGTLLDRSFELVATRIIDGSVPRSPPRATYRPALGSGNSTVSFFFLFSFLFFLFSFFSSRGRHGRLARIARAPSVDICFFVPSRIPVPRRRAVAETAGNLRRCKRAILEFNELAVISVTGTRTPRASSPESRSCPRGSQ